MVDGILKSCYPLLSCSTEIVDSKTVKVNLPPLRFLPDGEEDKTQTEVTGVTGKEVPLVIWAEKKGNLVNMELRGITYKVQVLECETNETPEIFLTIGDDGMHRISKTSLGKMTVEKGESSFK